jgi:hypothetical protein
VTISWGTSASHLGQSYLHSLQTRRAEVSA